MKILHIDDNEEILEPFETFFGIEDTFDYTSCTDPIKGLELIREENFDVILLDLAMPKLSGFDIIDSLYESGEIKNKNIVIFSASNMGEDELNGLMAKGVHSNLAKDTTIDKIITHLNNSFA